MKNFIYILIAGMLFVACSKDGIPYEKIIGIWELQRYYVNYNDGSYEKIDGFKSIIQFKNKSELIENTEHTSNFTANYMINEDRIVLSNIISDSSTIFNFYTIFSSQEPLFYKFIDNDYLAIMYRKSENIFINGYYLRQ